MFQVTDTIKKPEHRGFPPWLTPVIGGLAGLSLAGYVKLLGGDPSAMQLAMLVVITFVWGIIVTLDG